MQICCSASAERRPTYASSFGERLVVDRRTLWAVLPRLLGIARAVAGCGSASTPLAGQPGHHPSTAPSSMRTPTSSTRTATCPALVPGTSVYRDSAGLFCPGLLFRAPDGDRPISSKRRPPTTSRKSGSPCGGRASCARPTEEPGRGACSLSSREACWCALPMHFPACRCPPLVCTCRGRTSGGQKRPARDALRGHPSAPAFAAFASSARAAPPSIRGLTCGSQV